MTPAEPAPAPWTLAACAANLVVLTGPVAAVAAVASGHDVSIGVPLVAFLALVTAWCALEGSAGRGTPEAPVRRGSRAAAWLPYATGAAILATFWIALIEHVCVPRPGGGTAAVAGSGLMIVGIALRVAAIRTLGGLFLDRIGLRPAHPLVTEGIYARLRHPSEAGTLCLAFGGAVLLGGAGGFALAALVLLPLVLGRIAMEDELLADRHGAAFARYRRSVPALVGYPKQRSHRCSVPCRRADP